MKPVEESVPSQSKPEKPRKERNFFKNLLKKKNDSNDDQDEQAKASKNVPPGEYDPYVMRTGKHLTKNWEAWVNLVKSSVGAGLFGMPMAFKNAGLIVGLVSTIIIGAFCMFTLQLLGILLADRLTCARQLSAMYQICKWKKIPVITYQDAMKEAMLHAPERWHKVAKPAGWIVEFFLTFYQLGILAVYVVFISSNIKAVIDVHHKGMTVVYLMLPVTVLLLFLIQIRNMKLLAPVSVVANLSMLFGLSCILYYVFIALPPITDANMVGTIEDYPLYLGTVLFALEAVAVIISVENNMRTPKAFPGWFGVLNLGMFVVVFLYIFVGFLGYWRYTDSIRGSITLNMEPSDILAQVAKAMFAFAITLSYPLQAVPCVEVIWDKYLARRFEDRPKVFILVETCVRIGIVIFSLLLAVTVPDVGKIISLIGSFCLSMLAVGFPPLVHLFTFYPDQLGRHKWKLYMDAILFFLGVLVLCVGVYTSILDLIQEPPKATIFT